MRQNKALLGKYFPSFFSIELCNHEDIYKKTLRNDCTLFHEYIHFLQDITTTSGFLKLYNVKENLNLIRTEVSKTQRLSVPYVFDKNNQINEAVFEVIDSYSSHYFSDYAIKRIEKNDLNRAVRLVVSEKDSENTLFFGSYQIEEIMAECCESQHELHCDTNEFPYDLWSHFNMYFGYNLSKDDYALICYVSLFSTFPGYEFIQILDSLRRGLALNDVLEASFKKNEKNKNEFRKLAVESMEYFFSENFPEIVSWYKKSVENDDCCKSFLQVKELLKKMLLDESAFNVFVKNMSIPIVSDKYDKRKNDCHYGFGIRNDSVDTSKFYALIALRDIYNLLMYSEKACTMATMCLESGKIKVSYDCVLSPWRCTHGEKKCYYTVMWEALGLPSDIDTK